MDSLWNFTLEKVQVVGVLVKTKISFTNRTWQGNLWFRNLESLY